MNEEEFSKDMNDPGLPQWEIGVIHGRFQVLHNDHLKYLLAGHRLCRHLVVGITNPDPYLTKEDQADPGRSDRMANPLTYFERYVMVRSALNEKGIGLERFSVVPLPINLPELYKYYVPMDAVFFLTIYDDWGRKKRRLFESLGLKIHVLWEVSPEHKGISGKAVRLRISEGRPWEHLVPPSVAKLVKTWDVPARLRMENARR